jgi:predicted DNA-binding protein
MNKVQVNFRIPESLSDALDEKAEETGKTKTSLLCDALSAYLNIDTDTPDLSDILARLERLERKFEDTPKEPPKKKEVDPDKLGELITMDEITELTGYSKSTLSSKLSRESISAVKRIDGNRAGLYSKDEILEKIGTNK